MGKKEKSASVLSEDFKAMIAMVPKLEVFLKVHNEITAGYQKYRKNGGDAIPGIEKHLGIKKQDSAPSLKLIEAKTNKEPKASKEVVAGKKTKK
jgi:hypothetical protein